MFDKCLKQNDLIAVKRHNSYEWAIISAILYDHSETSVHASLTDKDISYYELKHVGIISKMPSQSCETSKGLYTIVPQSETLNNNYMETRIVSITLEQAKEWYKSDNAALRTIALSAFKDWELEEKFEDIVKDITYTSLCRLVPSKDADFISAYIDLCKLAEALNGDWIRKFAGKVWFFSGKTSVSGNGCKDLETLYHIDANYTSMVYFKDLRTINKAKEIILREWDRFKPLFI